MQERPQEAKVHTTVLLGALSIVLLGVAVLLFGYSRARAGQTGLPGEAPGASELRAQAVRLPAAAQRIGVDGSRANIPVDQILSGGPPPQGIPALGFETDWQNAITASPAPSYVTQEEAAAWLTDVEPVIAVTVNGETRGYPLQILTWHEIANDTLGGLPVAVTFCPLCNSALAFDRRVPLTEETQQAVLALNPAAEFVEPDAELLAAYSDQGDDAASVTTLMPVTFGVSGLLFNSNLLMFDNESSTLWSQILGEGNVGTLTDTRLLRLPAQIVSFADFRASFPDADMLSRDTGFSRSYGANPYVGYDDANTPPFLFRGVSDGRLPPKARVVSVERLEESVAYPFEVLADARVVNDQVADMPLAVFWMEGTASALDRSSIAGSADIGAVGVFERTLDGRELTFSWNGETFVDQETGSTWNLLGQATGGELEGKRLAPVVHDNTLWFAWAAFKPDTRLFTGG